MDIGTVQSLHLQKVDTVIGGDREAKEGGKFNEGIGKG